MGDRRGPASLVALRVEPAAPAFTRRPLAWPSFGPPWPRRGHVPAARFSAAPRGRRPGNGPHQPLGGMHARARARSRSQGRPSGLAHGDPSRRPDRLPAEPAFTSPRFTRWRSACSIRLGSTDTPLYPRKPYQAARLAHAARMRHVYTDPWCAAHNHPCDPDVFDEHLASDILVDARGEALVFVVAFDNTTGWSAAERWGRLEAFRELPRGARAMGRSGSAAGCAGPGARRRSLDRARNLNAGPHLAAALSADPELRDLVSGVLASSRPAEGPRGSMARNPRSSVGRGPYMAPARAPHRRPRRVHRGRLRLHRSPAAGPPPVSASFHGASSRRASAAARWLRRSSPPACDSSSSPGPNDLDRRRLNPRRHRTRHERAEHTIPGT